MENQLKPDVRSKGLMITPNKLDNEIREIRLNEMLPEFVKQRFEVIKKLIQHSYYVYEFLDVAFDYSFLTLEGALGEIYMKEHNHKVEMVKEDHVITVKSFESLSNKYHEGKWKVKGDRKFYPSLSGLIAWYKKRHGGILDQSMTQALRFFRNKVAHPHGTKVIGVQNISVIKKNCEFINSLFC